MHACRFRRETPRFRSPTPEPRALASRWRRSWGLASVASVAALVLAPTSCSDDPPATFLDASDLETTRGATFDPNDVVSTPALTDHEGSSRDAVDRLFRGDPTLYGHPSFLATYRSGGLSATDAVVAAAEKYRLHPLVFAVFAQASQGLLSAETYPFPPERVEYVFGCGCYQSGRCEPAFGGFDKQVDCLGLAFRTALDAIATDGWTASNWGPGQPSTTLDGVTVTPQNEATAALYDRLPVVAEGKGGGSWLFWNLWSRYARVIGYGATARVDFPVRMGRMGASTWTASSPTWPLASTSSTDGSFWIAPLTRTNASM